MLEARRLLPASRRGDPLGLPGVRADGCTSKIVLPSVVDSDTLPAVLAGRPGTPTAPRPRHRLTPEAYLGIVAATNFKQRVRKMLEYYHADRLNYAVAGTPNRLEYDQGFFVKLGDGAADVKPIAHLYKTQVYALAEYLGVPDGDPVAPADDGHVLAAAVAGGVLLLAALRSCMDLCLYAREQRRPARRGRRGATGLTVEQVSGSSATSTRSGRRRRYLHLPPQLVEQVLPDHPAGAGDAAVGSANGARKGSPRADLRGEDGLTARASARRTRPGHILRRAEGRTGEQRLIE